MIAILISTVAAIFFLNLKNSLVDGYECHHEDSCIFASLSEGATTDIECDGVPQLYASSKT